MILPPEIHEQDLISERAIRLSTRNFTRLAEDINSPYPLMPFMNDIPLPRRSSFLFLSNELKNMSVY